jgi:hypothetical protein
MGYLKRSAKMTKILDKINPHFEGEIFLNFSYKHKKGNKRYKDQ